MTRFLPPLHLRAFEELEVLFGIEYLPLAKDSLAYPALGLFFPG